MWHTWLERRVPLYPCGPTDKHSGHTPNHATRAREFFAFGARNGVRAIDEREHIGLNTAIWGCC